ncbi:MAG: hypothetical protein H6677_05425 [Candidatus Obscuribacterales bacterium]|nr:hypothetical protein [Candidatus Obscuribacterales bacterium]
MSGERASFLAGGEIPILQAIATAGQNQFSVTFEPFGMRINMIPVLMENGAINLEVAPEERVISNAFAFNFPGSSTNIPGFTTRKGPDHCRDEARSGTLYIWFGQHQQRSRIEQISYLR